MASAVTQIRTPGANFDLTMPDLVAEIHADGVSQVLFGYPLSRLVFHVTTSPPGPDQVEQRKAVLSLSINIFSLAQVCQQILATLASNQSQIVTAQQQYDQQLNQLLAGVPLKTSE